LSDTGLPVPEKFSVAWKSPNETLSKTLAGVFKEVDGGAGGG